MINEPSKQYSAMICALPDVQADNYNGSYYVQGAPEELAVWIKSLPVGAVIEVIVKSPKE
jgi:hypothetical protein